MYWTLCAWKYVKFEVFRWHSGSRGIAEACKVLIRVGGVKSTIVDSSPRCVAEVAMNLPCIISTLKRHGYWNSAKKESSNHTHL